MARSTLRESTQRFVGTGNQLESPPMTGAEITELRKFVTRQRQPFENVITDFRNLWDKLETVEKRNLELEKELLTARRAQIEVKSVAVLEKRIKELEEKNERLERHVRVLKDSDRDKEQLIEILKAQIAGTLESS